VSFSFLALLAEGLATFTQCRDTATGKSTVVNAVLAEPVSEGLVEEYADARRARLFRLGGQGVTSGNREPLPIGVGNSSHSSEVFSPGIRAR
jgi:hypothetical protein